MQLSKDYLIACCRSGTISWDGVGWISKQALQRRIEFDLIYDIGDDDDCDDSGDNCDYGDDSDQGDDADDSYAQMPSRQLFDNCLKNMTKMGQRCPRDLRWGS